MSTLPDRQLEMLEHIVRETREGRPPILSYLAQVAGVSRPVARAAVGGLIRKQFIMQAYASGPYIPLKTPDGAPLQLQLVQAHAA